MSGKNTNSITPQGMIISNSPNNKNKSIENQVPNINVQQSSEEEYYKKAKAKYSEMSEKKKKELQFSMSWFLLTDNIIKKTRLQIQSRMKIMDLISLFLAALGVFTNILSSFYYINYTKSIDGGFISILVEATPSTTVQVLRGITSLSTLILLILIFFHYKTRLTFLIFKQREELDASLYSTGLIYPMIMELIICTIHSYPFMDNVRVYIDTTGTNPIAVPVDIDLIISIIIPWRVYLLFRFFAFYSGWTDDRAERICNECNANGGVSFAIKAELMERPYTTVGFLVILSILIFGYGLRNIELAFMQNVPIDKFQDWRYIWNGFWCIIITILTVGYGDFYPQTHVGRALTVIACLWGTFLISLMVVSMTNSVNFTQQEEKAYFEIKKEFAQYNLKNKAGTMIRDAVELKNVIEQGEDTSFIDAKTYKITLKEAVAKFKKSLNEFKSFRKQIISAENEISTETILSKLNQCISEDMEELINLSKLHTTSLIGHIGISKELQKQIKNYTEKLKKLTTGLHKCVNKESYKVD